MVCVDLQEWVSVFALSEYGFLYPHYPEKLVELNVLKGGVNWSDPENEDGWDEGDREDC